MLKILLVWEKYSVKGFGISVFLIAGLRNILCVFDFAEKVVNELLNTW